MLPTIATLKVLKVVKTDSGAAYVSQPMKTVFHGWCICHLTGIPHSSTGQAVVESTQAFLKNMLL